MEQPAPFQDIEVSILASLLGSSDISDSHTAVICKAEFTGKHFFKHFCYLLFFQENLIPKG